MVALCLTLLEKVTERKRRDRAQYLLKSLLGVLCIFDLSLNGFYVLLLFKSQTPKVYVFPYIRFFQEMLRPVKLKQAVSL